jgi:hypothetical protein
MQGLTEYSEKGNILKTERTEKKRNFKGWPRKQSKDLLRLG